MTGDDVVTVEEPVSAVSSLPALPSLVVGRTGHMRHTPKRHGFSYRTYQWLVDLDDLPEYRWPMRALAAFNPADHLDGGRLGGGIRGDLERFLAERGVTLDRDDQVIMLANARVLGHTFNPLTVYWCRDRAGRNVAVVFEVHNTYGQRHTYLLEVDPAGRAEVDKAFYVSPFNDVSGRYRIRLRMAPGRVAATIVLERDGHRVLTASVSGTPVPATTRAVLSVSASHLLITQRVSLLIRIHGIWLVLLRLPRFPRPGQRPAQIPQQSHAVREEVR